MILETKNDQNPKSEFLTKGFSERYRNDRVNTNDEGILFYVPFTLRFVLRFEGIPSNHLSVEPLPSTCLFLELKLQEQKCSVPCS